MQRSTTSSPRKIRLPQCASSTSFVISRSSLHHFPRRGKPRDDVTAGVRTLVYRKRATIAYQILGDTVEVARVFYAGRDYEAILRRQGTPNERRRNTASGKIAGRIGRSTSSPIPPTWPATSPRAAAFTRARRSRSCGGDTGEVAFAVAMRRPASPSCRRAANRACRRRRAARRHRAVAARLDRIREIDPVNATITVEAGCILQNLQEPRPRRPTFLSRSRSPSEGSCRIGGNLSTNAGGAQVLRYGNTRDLVLGLEVVLADGRVWNGLRALRKDNSGYDLRTCSSARRVRSASSPRRC